MTLSRPAAVLWASGVAAVLIAPAIVTEVLVTQALAADVRAARVLAAETNPAAPADSPDANKFWQAVAPGRVEPQSGEIAITAPLPARIAQVLVKVSDKVFAGEPLVRLEDDEIRSRVTVAQAQLEMRKRARNDQRPSTRALNVREAEDDIADGEQNVVDARAALDQAAALRRGGKGSDAELEAARARLTRARADLERQKNDLRQVLQAESSNSLPAPVESELKIARAELLGAQAAAEKLIIRAPIDGTVLAVNAKAGELAVLPAAASLVLLGDVSAMRVRAELDERDFAGIKIGQTVVVRSPAFRDHDFEGRVQSIAPVVQPSRIARDQRNGADVSIVEVVVDLVEAGPLVAGMKVDVYFRYDKPRGEGGDQRNRPG